MLKEICPRYHERFSSLPLLGQHVEKFVVWLHDQGYPFLPIRLRVNELPGVDEQLWQRGVRQIEDLTASDLLSLVPRAKKSNHDVYVAAALRSLVRWCKVHGRLAEPPMTLKEELVAEYRNYLDRVRGLADSTLAQHSATAKELLSFIGIGSDPQLLNEVGTQEIEAFLRETGSRLSKESLQHTVSQLRSFLRFLAGRKLVPSGLDACIDTPRLYRGERIPCALPWSTVQAFLASIDRSSHLGERDYAMFMLIATYGLRISEVAELRLDDIQWRVGQLRVSRPKTNTALLLPLTEEVGAALIAYLRNSRPELPHREIFLRGAAPGGPLGNTGVGEAFGRRVRRSGLPIAKGPHCLRHSLAVQLLRQGTSLKAIGDLLGHRSAESTCVYLRLNVEDLRDVALDLPPEVRR